MFISLDLETTGFDPIKDKVIEFGAIKFNQKGEEIETLQFLCNPGFNIPQIVTHITKITDEDLKNHPPFDTRLEEVKNVIGDLPIIGHNIQFDINFLISQGMEIPNPAYDTHELASMLCTGLPSYSLEVLSQIFQLSHSEKHRALDDAIAAKELFLKLIEEFQYLAPDILKKIQELSQKSNWPFKNLLNTLEPKTGQRIDFSKIQKSKNHQQKTSTYQKILTQNDSALFETIPPYHKLIIDLSENAPANTYIAIPYQLFREIESHIPNTIAKIDTPENYLSLKRLEEFSQKKIYELYEILALLKYLIWSRETKTGLISEIRLKGEESKTIEEVNINQSISNPNEEFFYKKALIHDQSKAIICSHHHLISSQLKNPALILIGLRQFINSLKRTLSVYITLRNLLIALEPLQRAYPENKTLEALTSKCTILFGLVGIIFDQSNDENAYTPRSTINAGLVNSKQWQQAKETLSNLIEFSQELGEIKNDKTYGYLRNWKKMLEDLHKVFFDPEILQNMTWIEKDFHENLIIRKTPTGLNEKLKEIFQNCQNYKIIEEAIDLNDKGLFFKTNSGIDETLPLYKLDNISPNITVNIVKDINDSDRNQLPNFFIKYLKEKPSKTALIFNSKKELDFFTLKLSQANLPTISQSIGSIGKIQQLLRQDTKNSALLITAATWINFGYYEEIERIFIHKLPFDPPSHADLLIQNDNYENPFMQLQVPRAITNLQQIINRLHTDDDNDNQPKEVILLDPRLLFKDYGENFIKNLELSATVKTTKLEEL